MKHTLMPFIYMLSFSYPLVFLPYWQTPRNEDMTSVLKSNWRDTRIYRYFSLISKKNYGQTLSLLNFTYFTLFVLPALLHPCKSMFFAKKYPTHFSEVGKNLRYKVGSMSNGKMIERKKLQWLDAPHTTPLHLSHTNKFLTVGVGIFI